MKWIFVFTVVAIIFSVSSVPTSSAEDEGFCVIEIYTFEDIKTQLENCNRAILRLLYDVEGDEPLQTTREGSELVLDLNGHMLTVNANVSVGAETSLTIRDSGEEGLLRVFGINFAGKLFLQGGRIERSYLGEVEALANLEKGFPIPLIRSVYGKPEFHMEGGEIYFKDPRPEPTIGDRLDQISAIWVEGCLFRMTGGTIYVEGNICAAFDVYGGIGWGEIIEDGSGQLPITPPPIQGRVEMSGGRVYVASPSGSRATGVSMLNSIMISFIMTGGEIIIDSDVAIGVDNEFGIVSIAGGLIRANGNIGAGISHLHIPPEFIGGTIIGYPSAISGYPRAVYIDANGEVVEVPDGTTQLSLPFSDVLYGEWHYGYSKALHDLGISDGYEDGTFRPNELMTRAEFVAMLFRMASPQGTGVRGQGSEDGGYEMLFTDVDGDDWYYDAVMWAAENEIVSGTSDTTFSPGENITREQMAAILARYTAYMGEEITPGGGASEFSDYVKVSEYARGAIDWAVDAGLITGKGDGTLDPQGNATRAEVAAVLARYLTE